MIIKQKSTYILCMTCILLLLLSSCGAPAEHSAKTTPNAAVSSPENTSNPYIFPEDGVLTPLENGNAPFVPDGQNPSFYGDKLLLFFDFAFQNTGLQLANDTVISYTLETSTGIQKQETTFLDTSVAHIQNKYGYIGICFDAGTVFEKYERASFTLSFKDVTGKEYTVPKQSIHKGISYYGLSQSAFDLYLKETVTTTVNVNSIYQSGIINGTDFSLTILLNKWEGNTSAEKVITASRLFWECYPRMYARFGKAADSPKNVTLNIENEGYGIAWASGNLVHLHDNWLKSNPNDYDCLTHEFAHVIQNGWDGDYCEYSGYIERFADCCRYLYAFQNGKYNDTHWELQTVQKENTRETSVRFLVWLDYTYSTKDNDLLLKFFTACRDKRFPSQNWSEAWREILHGSKLEGMDIEQIWKLYSLSDFATLSSLSQNSTSALLAKYPVRQ